MRPPEMTRASTEMELRCAKAACCGRDGIPCKRGPEFCDAVDYLDMVRAVFREAREPTEAMLDALAADWTAPNDGRRYPVTRHCFAVMIDAASPAP